MLLVARDWAGHVLGVARDWLIQHSTTIAAGIVFLLALALLRSGVARLTA